MQLYYRHGAEFIGQTQTDEKGKPFTIVVDKCHRCGGAGGAEQWRYTGWKCYRCGGNGKEAPRAVKLYTQEQLDKLNAAQAKRDAKKAAEVAAKQAAITAERSARREQFLSENAEIIKLAESLNEPFINDILKTVVERAAISERQIEVIRNRAAEIARKAQAAFIGTVGERREFVCHLHKFIKLEGGQFGPSYIHIMRDAQGNTVKYKGSKILGGVKWEGERYDRYPVVDSTEEIKFVATITEHSEYKDEKQTIVARPKLQEEKIDVQIAS